MRGIYLGCIFVFLSSLGGWAFMAHQDSPVARGLQAQERASLADQQFAWRAAQAGMAEIKLSKLACTRSLSSVVRSFGEQAVAQYTNVATQLRDATAGEGIALPNDISPEDQDRYEQLARLSGRAFDRAYVENIVQIHQDTLSLLQNEAKAGRSNSIRNYAEEAASIGQEQLDRARQMLRSVTP